MKKYQSLYLAGVISEETFYQIQEIDNNGQLTEGTLRNIVGAGAIAGGMIGSDEMLGTNFVPSALAPTMKSRHNSRRIEAEKKNLLSKVRELLTDNGLHKDKDEVRFSPDFVQQIYRKLFTNDIQGAMDMTQRQLAKYSSDELGQLPPEDITRVEEYEKIHTDLFKALQALAGLENIH